MISASEYLFIYILEALSQCQHVMTQYHSDLQSTCDINQKYSQFLVPSVYKGSRVYSLWLLLGVTALTLQV